MIIYKTTNLITGRIYVGKDEGNTPEYIGSGTIIRQSIKKYGKSNFLKETLEHCSAETINDREKYWIKKLSATNREIGYNIALGGEGGDTISNHPRKTEIAKTHSEKMKGVGKDIKKGPLSSECKSKISNALSGHNNPMYGKYHSEETKRKMSDARKGHSPDASTRKKISKANLGRSNGPHSEETKRKMSDASKGCNGSFFGKTHSDASKKLMSETKRGRPKSNETKEKIRKALLGKYHGTQNKLFIANGVTFTSLGHCNRVTEEPIHIIRKKLKNDIYQYTNNVIA